MTSTVAHAAAVVAPHVVSHVTVYEDRADVVRRAVVTVAAGASTVVIRGVSPLVDEARLTARIEGDGHVDDVVIERRFDSNLDAIAARRRQRAVSREARTIEREAAAAVVAGAEHRRRLVETLARSHAQATARRIGRGEIDIERIDADVAAFQHALVTADDGVIAARAELLRIDLALAALGDDDEDIADATASRRVCDLHVRLSSTGGPITLVVSTVVPCAAWRPSHDAQLVRDDEAATAATVRFISHGAVWNRTGEDWCAASITLSTARPSSGAGVPTLHADRLSLRLKSVEERRQIVVAHRSEAVPQDATQGGAPGVDDGGEVRSFVVDNATILDDGRPHRLQLFSFEAPCALLRLAVPEKATQVFLRASFKNAGRWPLLAGPVSLSDNGAFIGTGDILYTGVGDDVDLAFGSDDGVRVVYARRRIDEKRLVGKDLQHWVQEAVVTSTRTTPLKVQVLWRLPVSELAQVKIVQSPQHGTVGELAIDSHGLARVDTVLEPGKDKRLAVAFVFDAASDVVLPPPW